MKKILLLLLLCPFYVKAQIITTIAGTGVAGYNGDGIEATTAQLDLPYGIAVDNSGNVYIADYENSRIRKISSSSGIITTVAGGIGDSCGTAINGIPATTAPIIQPVYVALDDTGNFYLACHWSNIRKVNGSTRIINTINDAVYTTDLALDNTGNIYFTTSGGTNDGFVMKWNSITGVLSTFAGSSTGGFSGDGGPASAAQFRNCNGIAVDASGNVYVSDAGNERIRKITVSTGIISTIAGNGSTGYSGDGYPATSAEFNSIMGLVVDGSGNIFITDQLNNAIRRVDGSTGIITTIAGNGVAGYGPDGVAATASQLNQPNRVTVDGYGNMYIADELNNRIREITDYAALSVRTNSTPLISNQSPAALIYPNPANSKITISSSTPINQVTISNIVGQSMYSQEYNSKNVDVNVADFPQGIYFVKINGQEVRKFVKE